MKHLSASPVRYTPSRGPLSHARHRSLVSIVAIALSLSAPLAQAQVVGGTISGIVTDSSGAVIPNATVIVRNEDTGTQRVLKTNGSGSFIAPSIPVGPYNVSTDVQGFAHYERKDIVLTVGESLPLTLSLHPAGATSITVDGNDLSPVNTSTEQSSGLVDSRQVKELPLNGRSYDQLILLNPGTVNYTNQRSGGTGSSNSSVGSMFSVSGRRPQDNLYLLNGVEYTGASLINVTPGGTSGQLLGIDGIHEFNVVSDTYSASYGKRDGAQISIVTQQGTNRVHGSAYEFLRNSFFDARNYFDAARIPEFQRNDYGASLGGPLRKDKFFLFGNYEGYRQNLGLSLVTLVPDNASRAAAVASVKPYLNLWPVQTIATDVQPGISEWIGTSPQHIREDFGTTRFDANLTPNDLFFAVYTVDDSTAHTPSSDPYSVVDEYLREQVFSVQAQHVFSPVLLNTARFGYSRASFLFLGSVPADVQANTPTFIPDLPTGAIVISGSTASNGASAITTAGANVGANTAITRNLFTFDDHIFYTLGRHQIEGGVWLQRLQSNDNLAQDQYGQASFASLATFLAGTIKTFTYAPSPTALGWRSLFVSGYLEDTFHLAPRLEVRAGLRTESSTGWSESQGRAGIYTFSASSNGSPAGVISTNPTVVSNAITDNHALLLVEPRLGVAWDVFGNGRTSLRASGGLHHSLLDALDYRLDQAAPYNTVYTYTGGTIASPLSGSKAISPSTVATDINTPALIAYALKLEQQIAPHTSLTVGYDGSHSYHQILSGDLNEPAFYLVNGRVFYPQTNNPKANPALANTTSWWAGGSGNYNALVVDLRQQLAHGLQLRGNYTWSKNLDDGSAWNTSVSANTPAFVAVPQLPHLDYGRAATDLRNTASINATWNIPLREVFSVSRISHLESSLVDGWSLSTIASLNSGFPFSPQLGYNPTNSGDSRNPVRPDVNPNFTGKLYPGGSTSQRVAQYFNSAAFLPPTTGYVGNASRDSLVGPGYADWDLSLLKSTRITEGTRAEFRAEFFNVVNHTNLALPNEVVFSSATALGTPGVITSTAGTSRQIQLGVKLLF